MASRNIISTDVRRPSVARDGLNAMRLRHPLQANAGKSRGLCKRLRAFTMIELMVVISIILIMTSILLPALGKAKQKAQEIKCLGNLRQCGLAVLQYAEDNNGWTPSAYKPFSGGLQWGAWLMRLGYIPGDDPLALLGRQSVLVCPSLEPCGKYLNPSYTYGFRRQYGPDWTFFQLYRGQISFSFYYAATGKYVPYSYSSGANPSSINILADTVKGTGSMVQWYYYTWGTTSITAQTIHIRHSNAANAWFADGHVGRMMRKDLIGSVYFDLEGNLITP